LKSLILKNKQMKNLIKNIALIALCISVVSCNDDETTPQQTIADIAINTANFSILETALTRTNLVNTLDGTAQYTVFAPTNEAFTIFFQSLGSSVTVDNVDVDVLKNILLNHVVSGNITSNLIPAATYVSTLSPINSTANAPTISLFVQKGDVVSLNGGANSKGAEVTTADILASNGVIHIVNRVIQIPTLVDHVIDNPNFDTLETVVTGSAQSAVLAALNGLTATAPATLFAPNNAAFTTALGVGGFANGASDSQVTKVLQYHVTVAGNVRSNQLSNNQVVPMITSPVQNTTVILGTGTVDIRDTASNLSRVIQADIQASNGVIHGVNKVLQPTL
jgi:uncharacterized surface protein with fasciclin (FAS1) repeats